MYLYQFISYVQVQFIDRPLAGQVEIPIFEVTEINRKAHEGRQLCPQYSKLLVQRDFYFGGHKSRNIATQPRDLLDDA